MFQTALHCEQARISSLSCPLVPQVDQLFLLTESIYLSCIKRTFHAPCHQILTSIFAGTVSTSSLVFSFLTTASVSVLSTADANVRVLENTRREETAKSVRVIEAAILFNALQLEHVVMSRGVVNITTDARGSSGQGASPEVEIGPEENHFGALYAS